MIVVRRALCEALDALGIGPNKSFGRKRREREVIADFQLPIVDLIRAIASTQTLGCSQTSAGVARAYAG
jgi:hypothetical protein